ncbi:MAG: hypothetical protein HFG62_16335 [Lachnospiraceae bacterium]|jgi:hypothetical protein|nr:hypothetical protein [Lachnospiraceae bacterium]
MKTREEWKELLKPIARGLFGKQGATRYERPHFPLRPLETMLKDLTDIPFADWYSYAFSREPLNGKFQDSQRRSWMEQSIACGYEYADRVRKEYGCETPEELAQAFGMQVTYPAFPEKTDRVLFAEFREPDQIRIYMDAVDRVRKYFLNPQVGQVLTEKLNITSLLLAHELFHYVEETRKKEIFTRTHQIRLWSLGPLHNDSGIMILGEIAAMAFAQKLVGIPYAPYVMDVFLVYGYSPEEASGLYEEMMQFAGREPCASL